MSDLHQGTANPKQVSRILGSVRNWLIANYLADPTPGKAKFCDDEAERIVLAPFQLFAKFILEKNGDLLPVLEQCRSAGWIEDLRIDITLSDDPGEQPPRSIARLNLPPGQHRVVGIRPTVLNPIDKNAGRKGTITKTEQKRRIKTLNEFDDSGLSQSEFARSKGIELNYLKAIVKWRDRQQGQSV